MKLINHAVIISLMFTGCAFAGEVIGADSSEPIIWEQNLEPKLRKELLAKNGLKDDLSAIHNAWNKADCPNSDDYYACISAPPKKPIDGVFDVIKVGRPDFNNDNKPDLVLYLTSKTGFSSSGKCAIMNVWFYENTGSDFRNIGKTEFLVSHKISVTAKKDKGQFRDIIAESYDATCFVDTSLLKMTDKYDYNKNAYYGLEIK